MIHLPQPDPAPYSRYSLIAFAILVACIHTCKPARADDWTDQEVALGRLCWSEASGRVADCIAIVEARGHWSLDRLRSAHRRALGTTHRTRPWIPGLSASMERPEHWPVNVPWETRGRHTWARILGVVRDTLAGRRSVCSERPSVWGSPTLDRERIDRILAAGGRVVCEGTANVFLRLGRQR